MGASLLQSINSVGKDSFMSLGVWSSMVVFLKKLVVFVCCWAQMGIVHHLQC